MASVRRWKAKDKFEADIRRHIRNIWLCILRRCTKPKDIGYYRYGGRGIRVCEEWASSKESFYRWALSAGYRIGLAIDRIDNNGHYSPDNCRWVTSKQNARNRRDNVMVTAFGETKCIEDWGTDPRCAVSTIRLWYRIRRSGWDHERAITTPPLPPNQRQKRHDCQCARRA